MASERGPQGQLERIGVVAAVALMFCWPLVVNRAPVLFPDSPAYLVGGRWLWSAAAGPGDGEVAIGGRSLAYGAFAWALRSIADWQAIAVVQAIWLAAVVVAAARRLGLVTGVSQLATGAALTAGTSLPFFAAVILPDVFAGSAVVAAVLLLVDGRAMTRRERWAWAAHLFVVITFHKAFLLLAGAVVVAGLLAAWRLRAQAAWWPTAATVIAAGAAGIALDPLATRFGGREIVQPPFLLARGIGDGTVARVLQDDCPKRHFVNCRVLPGLPMTENQFLWGGNPIASWAALGPAGKRAVAAEQNLLVATAVQRYPVMQAEASLRNGARLLTVVHLGQFKPLPATEPQLISRGFDRERREQHRSRIWRDEFPLVTLSRVSRVVYVLALSGSALLLVFRRRLLAGVETRVIAVAALLTAALPINALINGTLAGFAPRYQARLSWLALFALLILAHHLMAARQARAAVP